MKAMKTKKNLPKTKKNKNTDTHVYHRLARYPVFPLSPKKKVVQQVKEGMVIMQSVAEVSTEHFEKLFVLLHLDQKGLTEREILVSEKFEGKEFILIKCKIKEIAKILNSKDYKNIVEAFEKLATVTITFVLKNYKGEKERRLTTHPILFADYKESETTILIGMEKFFYEICLEKSLQINIKHYVKLSPLAKNLYLFLLANYEKNEFNLDTVCQRTNLHLRPSDARKQLRKALKQIANVTGLLKSATVEKDIIKIR